MKLYIKRQIAEITWLRRIKEMKLKLNQKMLNYWKKKEECHGNFFSAYYVQYIEEA